MIKSSWTLAILAVLFMALTLSSHAESELDSPYKPLANAVILGELYGTGGTESATTDALLNRFASLNTIVIDPGHGGGDVGALGPTGLQEKDVVLRVAKTLKTLLQTGLGSRVFLTREDDSELKHEERVGIANSLKADLYISIHTAASPRKSMKGMEIFLPSDIDDPREPVSGRIEKKPSGMEGNEIFYWGSVHLRYLPMNRLLGRLVQLNLSREMNRKVMVRELPMVTLEGVNMPSLELDVGYITTLSTETELKRDAHIKRMVAALFNGIKQYRETLILSRREP